MRFWNWQWKREFNLTAAILWFLLQKEWLKFPLSNLTLWSLLQSLEKARRYTSFLQSSSVTKTKSDCVEQKRWHLGDCQKGPQWRRSHCAKRTQPQFSLSPLSPPEHTNLAALRSWGNNIVCDGTICSSFFSAQLKKEIFYVLVHNQLYISPRKPKYPKMTRCTMR